MLDRTLSVSTLLLLGALSACSADPGAGSSPLPEDDAEVPDAAAADVTPATDAATCGVCAPPHATGVCKGASCAVSTCASGYADCDHVAKNGCESLLASDVAHCGACGKVCDAPLHGSSTCSAGSCQRACDPGWETCGSSCCLAKPMLGTMDAGDRFNCAITSTATVKCWGSNSYGKLGIGTLTPGTSATPVDVPGLSNVVQVTTGREHACALDQAGAVKCWGGNFSGQLGLGTTTNTYVPTTVPGLTGGVAMVGAGHTFSCALMATGSVKCWGQTALGNGTTGTSNVPVDVVGITDAVMISTGYSHACALSKTGAVRCWGSYLSPAVGTPAPVAGLGSNVVAITSGQSSTLALLADGTVWQWSTGGSKVTPAAVQGLTGAVQITADYTHACAVTSAGAAKCWGGNSSYQLGTTGTATGLVDPPGLGSGVASIHAGDWHTCAVLKAGGIRCFGMGSEGQLGDGVASTPKTATPVAVLGF